MKRLIFFIAFDLETSAFVPLPQLAYDPEFDIYILAIAKSISGLNIFDFKYAYDDTQVRARLTYHSHYGH